MEFAAIGRRSDIFFTLDMIVRVGAEIICTPHLRWGWRLAIRSHGVRGIPGPKSGTWGTHSFENGRIGATHRSLT